MAAAAVVGGTIAAVGSRSSDAAAAAFRNHGGMVYQQCGAWYAPRRSCVVVNPVLTTRNRHDCSPGNFGIQHVNREGAQACTRKKWTGILAGALMALVAYSIAADDGKGSSAARIEQRLAGAQSATPNAGPGARRKSGRVLVFRACEGRAGNGGQYGEGALLRWEDRVPSNAGVSTGLQAGVQKYGYDVLHERRRSRSSAGRRLQVGVGPTVVKYGRGAKAKSTTTTSMKTTSTRSSSARRG